MPSQALFVLSRTFSESYRHLAFSPAFGLHWQPINNLHVGLVMTLPATKIWGKTSVNRGVTRAGSERFGGPDNHTQEARAEEEEAILKTPMLIRAALGYEQPDAFALELSAQFNTEIADYLDRSPTLPNSTEAEHNLDNSIPKVHLHGGAELILHPQWRVRFGSWWKPSLRKPLGKINSEEAAKSNNNSAAGDATFDIIGGSLALSVGPKATQTSYGIQVARGNGQVIGFLTTPANIQNNGLAANAPLHTKSMQIQPASSWEIGFFISGTIETGIFAGKTIETEQSPPPTSTTHAIPQMHPKGHTKPF